MGGIDYKISAPVTSIDNKNGMIFFSGHVPEKCTMTNRRLPGNQVYGELNCPDAIETDQGAYSCEAISSMVRGKMCDISTLILTNKGQSKSA